MVLMGVLVFGGRLVFVGLSLLGLASSEAGLCSWAACFRRDTITVGGAGLVTDTASCVALES